MMNNNYDDYLFKFKKLNNIILYSIILIKNKFYIIITIK